MSSNEYTPLIDKCKQMLSDGKTIDDVLKYLRVETNSKVTSIMVVVGLLNISAGEAKLLVHRSEAWNEVRERDEKIHETIYAELDKINEKNRRK